MTFFRNLFFIVITIIVALTGCVYFWNSSLFTNSAKVFTDNKGYTGVTH